MSEDECSYKSYQEQKTSPRWEENRKAMNANKIKSRSPNEAVLNKGRSLKKQNHYET